MPGLLDGDGGESFDDGDEVTTRTKLELVTMGRSSWLLLLASVLLCGLVASSFALPAQTGVQGGCGMSWMTPHYVHLDGLDRQHSRLANKYGLYLYRESGWDSDRVDGVPVLFAPGNAGSFRQVRSIASSAARQYYNESGQALGAFPKREGASHLDFFAVDFNEDFSAFHGATLLEQAEYLNDAVAYILALYQRQPAPTSVLLLAHSMGGISARKMFTMVNHRAGSVNTLVTLSTPHQVPPATFDGTIETVYADNARLWQRHYALTDRIDAPLHLLANFLLISISGGTADTMISSDATSLAELARPQHGFAVFTTSVPRLYAPVDHQAMMWCDQLRAAVARALLESVDIRQPSQSRSLADRNAAFRHRLLGEAPWPSLAPNREPGRIAMPDLPRRELGRGVTDDVSTNVLYIIESYTPLAFFSDVDPADLDVYFCDEPDATACTDFKPAISGIPRSRAGQATGNQDPLQSFAHIADMGHSIVVVHFKALSAFAITADMPAAAVVYDGLFSALFGFHVALGGGLVSDVHIPALDSSLLVYHIALHTSSNRSQHRFAPLLRVTTARVEEAHWYPDFQIAGVYLHGEAPFIPASGPTIGEPRPPMTHAASADGLVLRIWRDPEHASQDDRLRIRIAVFASLGKVVLRYRTAFAAWPLAFALLVLARQLGVYRAGGQFSGILRALALTLRKVVVPMSAAMVALGALQALLLPLLSRPISPWLLGALLGNVKLFFILLPIPLLIATSGFLLGLAFALQALVIALAFLYGVAGRLRSVPAHSGAEATPGTKRRLVFLVALAMFVAFFAPCQFAFLVLVLVHLATTVSSLVAAREAPPGLARHAWDHHHYHLSALLVLLALVPLAAPILVVWSRNLLAGWYAPFSSDRNPVRVLGFLLWTDAVHHAPAGRVLPDVPAWLGRTSQAMAVATAAYVFVYGVRYTYVAFPLANVLFGLLAAWHLTGERRARVRS